MIKLTKPKDLNIIKTSYFSSNHKLPILIVKPKETGANSAAVLWIHGGGYVFGMKEMVYFSRAIDLVRKYKVTVFSPGYRLAFNKPFPAAFDDCYSSLLFVKNNALKYGINDSQIFVGGESAGAGLAIALCLKARDSKDVNIAYQMPLYPMIDNLDTETSKDNHGKIWNSKRNHFGWKMYLRKNAKNIVSKYATPAREIDYSNLPPCYSFVSDKEPFYFETKQYIQNLQDAGVEANLDVYNCNIHAFDMLKPKLEISKAAIDKFNERFEYALNHYFVKQE